MLIGIPTCIGPDLLALLHRMGHGDELVLADAFFCGETFGRRVVRADGIRIPELLDGILGLMNLDDKVPDPLVMMEPSPGDPLDPEVEASFRAAVDRHWPEAPVKYGNIIIKKGVIPIANQGR